MTNIQLYAGGKRERVQEGEAQRFVERWTREKGASNKVIRVDISCRSWAQPAFDIIRPFLETIAKDVKYAAFADIIASLLTEEGLAVTEALAKTFANAPLADLDLSDNAMGPRGLVLVEPMIVNAPLKRLYLRNCGLSFESMGLLKGWFTANDNRIANQLTDIVIDRNMFGEDGAKEVKEILAHCKRLEYFSCLGCRVRTGAIHLAQGLEAMVEGTNHAALYRLDIDDCTFDEEGCAAIANALSKCSRLTRLALPDAGCEIDGLKLIVDALTTSGAKLTHLDLDGCGELGNEGAQILAKYLDNIATTLKSFKCSNNELGDEGLPILLEPFGATKCSLEEIHLECNELGVESAKALVGATLPSCLKINVADNDDLPKKILRKKYGDVIIFGEGDEEEEDEDDDDGDLNELVQQFRSTNI